jgi:hypothetical protein
MTALPATGPRGSSAQTYRARTLSSARRDAARSERAPSLRVNAAAAGNGLLYTGQTGWALATLLLVVAAVTGCSRTPATNAPTTAQATEDAPTTGLMADDTATWTAQVAEVAAGRSDTIRPAETVDDRQLAELAELDGLRSLWIEDSRITDAGLEHLVGLHGLQRLKIRGAAITDNGLRQLTGMKDLRYLNLPQADLTDQGLVLLAAFPRLESLRLGSPRLTDEGLLAVASLGELRFLHRIDVPVSDKGLVHLRRLDQLESLYLDGAELSDDGVVGLLEALPQLHLHLDQQHHDRDPRKHD